LESAFGNVKCFAGSFKIAVYVDFVRRLMLNADAPVFLIADGHPVHRCKAIRELAAESDGRLCLFFLPAYAPDLNPDELVWGNLKHHKIGKLAIKGPGHLKRRVRAVLRGTTWAPVAQTPVVEATGARFKVNLISAVSPRGQLRFMWNQLPHHGQPSQHAADAHADAYRCAEKWISLRVMVV
jgi:hypothetical protein